MACRETRGPPQPDKNFVTTSFGLNRPSGPSQMSNVLHLVVTWRSDVQQSFVIMLYNAKHAMWIRGSEERTRSLSMALK